jgi:hypothetical protein
VLYDRQDVDAFIRSGRVETSGVVRAPGPERRPARTPKGPGTDTTVRQTASQGSAGVAGPGNISANLDNDRKNVA